MGENAVTVDMVIASERGVNTQRFCIKSDLDLQMYSTETSLLFNESISSRDHERHRYIMAPYCAPEDVGTYNIRHTTGDTEVNETDDQMTK